MFHTQNALRKRKAVFQIWGRRFGQQGLLMEDMDAKIGGCMESKKEQHLLRDRLHFSGPATVEKLPLRRAVYIGSPDYEMAISQEQGRWV